MRESLRFLVELIQRLIACDPKRTVAIFEEGSNNNAVEAIRISWISNENFKGVSVVAVQSISRPKPHKTLLILHHVIHFCLRHPFGCGEAQKAVVRGIDNGQSDRLRRYADL